MAVRIVIMLCLLTYRQLENCPRSRMEVRPTPLPSLLTLTLTFDFDLRLWFSIPDELMKTIATRNYRPIVFLPILSTIGLSDFSHSRPNCDRDPRTCKNSRSKVKTVQKTACKQTDTTDFITFLANAFGARHRRTVKLL